MKGKQVKKKYHKQAETVAYESQLKVALQEIDQLQEQLEERVHNEISLRAETKRLEHEKEMHEENAEQLKQENAKWKVTNQGLQEKNEALAKQLRKEADLIDQIKAIQKELSEYKVKTLEVLSSQKEPLEEISKEHENTVKKIKQLDNELIRMKKEEKLLKERLNSLRARHNQIMNTKMMKWTGLYWKLRKKLRWKKK
ncbi:hypothetical protein BMT55_02285 [Listeria newyorkensis]|uniref:Uncharacterized protein n=1 Tax=Listeria newyorkensis TaxID=1497681 RepID=A0ABX4XQ29_9LIST|nr:MULTISPECIES: hypothetical protein [Listeria]KGL42186.1 hypothetical protein EP56_10655 [Listeriaceae bacterium FSL A5-0209]KGL38221.1 hypothetical protein EP58_15800 [Listeria newyorkensis]PNP94336.1 hypothetical protein BMT55_02285 [Listeria newyorkensis]RQW67705.1 hypothetical protein DUK53_05140 [Listeria sp. SHR_NRA_18]WAO22750.1 hypothetical protein OTR81_05625 [Listeria newyorkensis]